MSAEPQDSSVLPVLDEEEIRLLADVALLALSRCFIVQARAILDALAVLRPEGDAYLFGEGMFWLLVGEPATAVDKLRAGPPADAPRVILGLALLRCGEREEGIGIWKDVLQTSRYAAARKLAQSLLDEHGEARPSGSQGLLSFLDGSRRPDGVNKAAAATATRPMNGSAMLLDFPQGGRPIPARNGGGQ